MVRIYARSVPHIHGHKGLDDDALLYSGINDWLVKLHPLHFDENADKNLSAVIYFQCRISKRKIFKPQNY